MAQQNKNSYLVHIEVQTLCTKPWFFYVSVYWVVLNKLISALRLLTHNLQSATNRALREYLSPVKGSRNHCIRALCCCLPCVSNVDITLGYEHLTGIKMYGYSCGDNWSFALKNDIKTFSIYGTFLESSIFCNLYVVLPWARPGHS